MARQNGQNKVTKVRRYRWLNIGTILFGAIFIYIVLTVIMYLTAKHVTSYEVTHGTISGNYRYKALALKSETVITAPKSGYLTYYARNGARAASQTPVCSISDRPSVSETFSSYELTNADASAIHSVMNSYAVSYKNSTFQDVYNFKADIESILVQGRVADDSNAYLTTDTQYAPMSGFVVYGYDGLEELEETEICAQHFNTNNYDNQNLRLTGSIRAGEPLYKLVTNEIWNLYFPVSEDLIASLTDRKSIRFRFLRDDTTFTAGFSLLKNADGYYGKITLNNSLVRYPADRYLEIELLMVSNEGLKVPISAIADDVFYKVPQDYVIENEDSAKEISIIRERTNSSGEQETTRLSATVYGTVDKTENDSQTYYLISPTLLENGDYLHMPNTSKKYAVDLKKGAVTIRGVYNINKGYAVFRQVDVLEFNEEFCIVEACSTYGLAAHDYIALHASKVDPNEIVY